MFKISCSASRQSEAIALKFSLSLNRDKSPVQKPASNAGNEVCPVLKRNLSKTIISKPLKGFSKCLLIFCAVKRIILNMELEKPSFLLSGF